MTRRPGPGLRPRRGFALMAALWLVVAIAAVALQFSLEAHERRTVGLHAAEDARQRALALGALALVQARLEEVVRTGGSIDLSAAGASAAVARLRAADPWLDADSLFSGPVLVDSVEVDVAVRDLGEQLNINRLTESDLQMFFSYLLTDYSKSLELAQAILDWRDADSLPRPQGAERDDYIKAGLLALPANLPFREVDDLRNVMGVTPEIFEAARPYLTTRGSGRVNLNTAPVPVLRALPGMTDATLNTILQLRSQGRRITSVDQVFTVRSRGRGRGGSSGRDDAIRRRVTTTTDALELTITARLGPQSTPTRLIAVMDRAGRSGATIETLIW